MNPAYPTCKVVKGLFDRWVLVNSEFPDILAWSGSRWVPHDRGIPTGEAQVSNFATEELARTYATQCGMEIVE